MIFDDHVPKGSFLRSLGREMDLWRGKEWGEAPQILGLISQRGEATREGSLDNS